MRRPLRLRARTLPPGDVGVHRSPLRATVAATAASLTAIIALGVALSAQISAQGGTRGKEQAIAQARQLATTDIEPLLPATGPVRFDRESLYQLQQIDAGARRAGSELRLRVRNAQGDVIFASEGAAWATEPGDGGDDDLRKALAGQTLGKITRVNRDTGDIGKQGPEAVEIYLPLPRPGELKPAAVVVLYVPYAPIHAAVAADTRRMLTTLGLGLLTLWLVLAAIGVSFNARLRRIASRNGWLATHDQLTGLLNRNGFASALDRRLREGHRPAVLLLDLERFSEVNDTLGQRAGDQLLVATAAALQAAAPPDGEVARLDGDVFGVLLETTEPVEDLRRAASQVRILDGITISPSVAAGVAVAEVGPDAAELLRRAEVALSTAKQRNELVQVFEPGLDAFDPDRLQLAADLRSALEHGEIEVHYQVKGDVATGEITGVEALARWNHPVRGQVSPVDFVGLAERTSMIASLTDSVVCRVVTDMATGVIPIDWHVAINVSARNLGDSEFPRRLARLVQDSHVSPNRICIEITETALMADPGRGRQALGQLSNAGFSLSLDDFGQGYTSLSQLGRLPLREVKIDRAFVSRATHSATDAAIVAAVIEIGHSLGMNVVAEGVEDVETLSLLHEWGCDGYQGWLLGRPVPAPQLSASVQVPSGVGVVPQQPSCQADVSSALR